MFFAPFINKNTIIIDNINPKTAPINPSSRVKVSLRLKEEKNKTVSKPYLNTAKKAKKTIPKIFPVVTSLVKFSLISELTCLD